MSATIPEELAARVAEARRVLAERPDGHLPLFWRVRVREALGPWTQDAQGRRSPGWLRRVRLARACAERVLGYWQAERPEDPRPQRMLELADQIVAGSTERNQVALEQGEFQNDVDLLESEEQISVRAFLAAHASAAVVVAAQAADYEADIPEEEDDERLDSDQWGAEHWAEQAEAYNPDMPDGDPRRRRAFWEWYLTEAVPAAYAAVPDR